MTLAQASAAAPAPPVFALRVFRRRLDVAGDDVVTAVAAAGDVLWVGTEAGRLLRFDVATDAVAEMRNRLGTSRFASPVWKIFADPYSRGALVVLRNADAHYATSSGELRPRWLSKLRGMRCVSAAWVRLPLAALRSSLVSGGTFADVFPGVRSASSGASNGSTEEEHAVAALLGTAFGSVFLLTLDSRNERDDAVRKVWAAPCGENIDGIRVERVAGNFVGTIATPSALYSLYGASTLDELFSSEEGDAVHHLDDAGLSHLTDGSGIRGVGRAFNSSVSPASSFESPLPSELQFLSGIASGGVASRRFVWAAQAGILHAQLALRSRRSHDAQSGTSSTSITASITEKAAVSWNVLKDKSGSSVPMACNLSTYHTLVLYPGSIYAYNQISGELTEVLDVWRPAPAAVSRSSSVSSPQSSSRGMGFGVASASSSPKVAGSPESVSAESLLSSPAAGFARDVLIDSLWVFTHDGQLARVETGPEEQKVAWRAAKAVRRFDLAMALAPFVSSSESDILDYTQSREAVLEAQADHVASNGDWEAASRLYAKTNRPIEGVIVDIIDACARDLVDGGGLRQTDVSGEDDEDDQDSEDGKERGRSQISGIWGPRRSRRRQARENGNGSSTTTSQHESVRDRGKDVSIAKPRARAGVNNISEEAGRLIIVYLVCKLDTIPDSNPSQRTIVATLLVELYASCLSRLANAGRESASQQAEVREDFGNFLADNSKDLHVPTAVAILASHRCYDFAQTVCVLTEDYGRAAEICLLHADVEDALSLVTVPSVASKPEVVAEILASLTPAMASRAPRRLAKTWAAAARSGNSLLDHHLLLTALARVARAPVDSRSNAAYLAATDYICHVLCGVIDASGRRPSSSSKPKVTVSRSADADAPGVTGCVAPLSPQWHTGVRMLFALHADCGVSSAEAEQSYDAVVRGYESDKSEDMRNTLRDLLMSGYRGKFWGLLARVYGALGQHQEAVSIALEHGEDGDSSAAEVHVLGAERSLPAHTVRQLWTQIAASSDDPLGVAERSNGMLRVDDALPLMQDFSRADPRVTKAVTDSLAEHQAAANKAAKDAQHTLGQTAAIRSDIASATAWRKQTERAPCGHRAMRPDPDSLLPQDESSGGDTPSMGEQLTSECPWCGPVAIDSLNLPML